MVVSYIYSYVRSLTPQDLADTLCGSPLYMAPEIIQNHKYDAKVINFTSMFFLIQFVAVVLL